MSKGTALAMDVTIASPSMADDDATRDAGRAPPSTGKLQRIVLAATFSADSIVRPLRFWLQQLEISADVTLAPYGQVMQELVDPASASSRNGGGLNAVLIRIDDWLRDRPDEDVEANVEHLIRAAGDFIEALQLFRERSSATILMFLAPPSSILPAAYAQVCSDVAADLLSKAAAMDRVRVFTHPELLQLYPATKWEDLRADRIAHIPYSDDYFIALATLLARQMAGSVKPPYKVIALDCDNTLWRGICGEDGPLGIELTPSHLEFQRLLVQQHDAGMLLCLCSKNNPADVDAVFAAHPEMPLRPEHVICSRVNWNTKSSNLASIAQELSLGLDSFILVDDSLLECTEVRTHCPSVLTLQYPSDAGAITHFLQHTWAFDHFNVTADAKRRTAQYRENRARELVLRELGDLGKFLASLELHVEITIATEDQLERVAELIQRTNQFNLTGIRRSRGELQALVAGGEARILSVHVRDRFGDYGLVGALLIQRTASTLEIDTFVLSCRALGRGVEYRIMNDLGRRARAEGIDHLVLKLTKTARNAPAQTFLQNAFADFRRAAQDESPPSTLVLFDVPVEYAETVAFESSTAVPSPDGDATAPIKSVASASSPLWHDVAFRLSRLEALKEELCQLQSNDSVVRGEYVAPRTPAEETVAAVWGDLLGVDAVSIREDFFSLGGDSLLAVRAIAKVAELLGLDLPLHEFFATPTIERVAAKLSSAPRYPAPIEHTSNRELTPASLAQQRLWFIDRLEGGSEPYYIPLAVRFDGELLVSALQEALARVVQRHEVLRTVFVETQGELMQKVMPDAILPLRFVDLSGISSASKAGMLREHSRSELADRFELSTGPLIRGRLLRFAAREHVLIVVMHHSVSDGWSLDVFVRELMELYRAVIEGKAPQLPVLPIQYSDYACWHQRCLARHEAREHLNFWKEHLAGAPELMALPTDRPRKAVRSHRGASVAIALEPELVARLRVLSLQNNVTLAMTLYAAWSALLARLSGQTDLVIGMPVANRSRAELHPMIGMFVNTLAVRIRLEGDPSVADLLRQVKRVLIDAYTHQDAPFEQVVEAVQPARSLSHTPVFQVMFVLQNPSLGALQTSTLSATMEDVPLQAAKFDVVLSLREAGDRIVGNLTYATDLFDAPTMARWAGYVERIMRSLVEQPHLPISRLSVMSADERHKIVETFNATRTDACDTLLHELFEAQVERSPASLAVAHESRSLTYLELNRRANQLARHLRSRGIGADKLVAICLERSVETVVAMLAVLKAGGAYVPLDPSNPPERIRHVLTDSAASVLITQTSLRRVVPESSAQIVIIDAQWPEIAGHAVDNLERGTSATCASNLAYVIYTSGSTGAPKGVMIEHSSIVNYVRYIQHAFDLSCGTGSLVSTSLSFDLALTGLYPPLICGRAVRLCAERQGLPLLEQEIERHAALAPVKLTPSHLSLLEPALREGRLDGRIRVLVLGGESLQAEALKLWRTYSPDTRIFNHYGPTETTVGCVVHEVRGGLTDLIPIGGPIANTSVYILDRHLQPTPIGVIGEIYIGGAGVARGYLNRPELTTERFLTDTLRGEPRGRMYKSGDLGRWRADGTIEYLGRNDHQLKIRGFRIEPGEISTQLLQHPVVREAVVVARENAAREQILVAYISLRGGQSVSTEQLRAHLKTVLPDYMLPSAYVVLEALPLTANGKLNTRALPAPDQAAYVTRHYEPPNGEIEQVLARIWAELLGLERVGRCDDFFELGGHSLLALRVVAHVRRVLELDLPVRALFDHPTIEALGAHIVQIIAEELSLQA